MPDTTPVRHAHRIDDNTWPFASMRQHSLHSVECALHVEVEGFSERVVDFEILHGSAAPAG